MPFTQRVQVETNLCQGYESSILACSLLHPGEAEPALSRIIVTKDTRRYTFNILVCEQCENPICVEACPSRTIVMAPRGVVMIIDDDCLRCGGCESNCPYHAIFNNNQPDRHFRCDLCLNPLNGPTHVEISPIGDLTLRLELRSR